MGGVPTKRTDEERFSRDTETGDCQLQVGVWQQHALCPRSSSLWVTPIPRRQPSRWRSRGPEGHRCAFHGWRCILALASSVAGGSPAKYGAPSRSGAATSPSMMMAPFDRGPSGKGRRREEEVISQDDVGRIVSQDVPNGVVGQDRVEDNFSLIHRRLPGHRISDVAARYLRMSKSAGGGSPERDAVVSICLRRACALSDDLAS